MNWWKKLFGGAEETQKKDLPRSMPQQRGHEQRPSIAPTPAPSRTSQQSQPPSSPQRTPEIVALCEQAANGTPTTFICYGSDEALFMARLKPFSAYATTTDGRLSVVGVRDSESKDFMVVCAGSKSEHAAFSAEGRDGGAVDKLDHELLTEEELGMRRPVSAYSNFAIPGCDLISLDGFNRCVAKLTTGTYTVVSPCDNNNSEKNANMQEAEAIISAMTRDEQKKVSLIENLQTMKVRCNASCKKEWSLSQCSDVNVREKEILFRCPGCGRNCWQDIKIFLVDEAADVNAKTIDGATPLSLVKRSDTDNQGAKELEPLQFNFRTKSLSKSDRESIVAAMDRLKANSAYRPNPEATLKDLTRLDVDPGSGQILDVAHTKEWLDGNLHQLEEGVPANGWEFGRISYSLLPPTQQALLFVGVQVYGKTNGKITEARELTLSVLCVGDNAYWCHNGTRYQSVVDVEVRGTP